MITTFHLNSICTSLAPLSCLVFVSFKNSLARLLLLDFWNIILAIWGVSTLVSILIFSGWLKCSNRLPRFDHDLPPFTGTVLTNTLQILPYILYLASYRWYLPVYSSITLASSLGKDIMWWNKLISSYLLNWEPFWRQSMSIGKVDLRTWLLLMVEAPIATPLQNASLALAASIWYHMFWSSQQDKSRIDG